MIENPTEHKPGGEIVKLKTIMNKPSLMHLINEMFLNSNKNQLNKFYSTQIFKDGLLCPCQYHIELCLEILNNKEELYIYKGEKIDEKTYIKTRLKETLNIIWRNHILNSKLYNPHIF
jgi:hypothetical protein